jgi:carbonic anhydrase
VLQVPLIIVLGHDECGAVRAAIDSQGPDAPRLPVHIERLVSQIVPAVRAAAPVSDDGTVDTRFVDALEVGKAHLRDTVAALLEQSELISTAIADGSLAIVGANYRLTEGRAQPDLVVGFID